MKQKLLPKATASYTPAQRTHALASSWTDGREGKTHNNHRHLARFHPAVPLTHFPNAAPSGAQQYVSHSVLILLLL